MKVSRLTLPILTLHYLVDQGERYSVDDIYSQIEAGTIFDDLKKKYSPKYKDIRLDGIKLNKEFPKDEADLIEALQRLANAVLPEELGVDNRDNGLLFLAGLLNELIQSNIEDIELK